jgi:hypothetical protein
MPTQTSPFGPRGPLNPLAPLWEQRERWIREAAYFKAEKRGFAPGHAPDDWLAAEAEVDAAIRPLPED